MLSRFIGVLLLLPSIAFAECGFSSGDQTMTIVVSKNSNKCFDSEGFRNAFKVQLTESLKAMDAQAAPAARSLAVPGKDKPAAPGQATLQEAEYYGQKRR